MFFWGMSGHALWLAIYFYPPPLAPFFEEVEGEEEREGSILVFTWNSCAGQCCL